MHCRTKGVQNLGDLFPNLTVIRGMQLFKDFALVIFDNEHLEVSSKFNILLYCSKYSVVCVDRLHFDLMVHAVTTSHGCPHCPLYMY